MLYKDILLSRKNYDVNLAYPLVTTDLNAYRIVLNIEGVNSISVVAKRADGTTVEQTVNDGKYCILKQSVYSLPGDLEILVIAADDNGSIVTENKIHAIVEYGMTAQNSAQDDNYISLALSAYTIANSANEKAEQALSEPQVDATGISITDILSGENTLLDACKSNTVGEYVKYKVKCIVGENGTIGAAELICTNIINSEGSDVSTQVLISYDMANAEGMPKKYARAIDPNIISIDADNAQTITEHHTSVYNGMGYDNETYSYTAPEGYKITSVMYTTGYYAVMLYEEMNGSDQMPMTVNANTWLDIEPCDEFWLWEANSDLTGTDVNIKIAPIVKGAWSEWAQIGASGGSESVVKITKETITVPANGTATYTIKEWNYDAIQSITFVTYDEGITYPKLELCYSTTTSTLTYPDTGVVYEAVEEIKGNIDAGAPYPYAPTEGEDYVITLKNTTSNPITVHIEETRK